MQPLSVETMTFCNNVEQTALPLRDWNAYQFGWNVVADMVSALSTPAIQAPHATNLMRTVLEGGAGAVTHSNPTGAGMPRFDWKLSDDDIAAVLTYVRNPLGNAASAVDSPDVAALRKAIGAKASVSAAMNDQGRHTGVDQPLNFHPAATGAPYANGPTPNLLPPLARVFRLRSG